MKSVKFAGVLGMLAGLCWSSQAMILAPGAIGLDAPQPPAAATALFSLVTPFASGPISGTITSWVVKDPANPLGGLSFYYQVSEVGPEAIGRVSSSDYGIVPGAPVDVATLSAPFGGGLPGGVLPNLATRSGGAGTVVGFLFLGDGLTTGEHSVVMVVNTPYDIFNITSGAVIDSAAVSVAILGPSLVPIPEPSSCVAGALLLLPFGASMLRVVRKR